MKSKVTATSKLTEEELPTFDFISIQLYESYSHAVYNVSELDMSPVAYLESFVQKVLSGWEVDYGLIPTPPGHQLSQSGKGRITIPASQLIIGLANGWADGTKALRVWPEEAAAAYSALGALSPSLQPRGFMFWDIADEGMVPRGASREMWMARGLNQFLHTRTEKDVRATEEVVSV
mmetsp:Transcript_6959/g.13295  ORF Transcript_6959/g.13295 Transcript_6959/m.13295 type:complete len:177 (+) Transcript_6959:1-531(+)